MSKGISYILAVMLVTLFTLLTVLTITGTLWHFMQGLTIKRAVQVTVTVYSNGLVKVELRNVGWGISIIDVHLTTLSVGGYTTTTIDLNWSPSLPLKPGAESIGIGYVNIPTLASAIPYSGTLEVVFSDGTRDIVSFSGTVIGI